MGVEEGYRVMLKVGGRGSAKGTVRLGLEEREG